MTADPPPLGPLVVIPCLNEADHLSRLISRIVPGLPQGSLLVIADGGSDDGTVEIIEAAARDHDNVVSLPNPKRIQSAAINLAVRRFGQGRRWLIRIDAHCGYPDDFVKGLVATAVKTQAQSVVVPMHTTAPTGACFQEAVAAAQNSVLGTGGSAHRRGGEGRFIDHGHHALFAMGAFAAAGGYDETFSHNEDAELDARLTRAEGRIWLEPKLAVQYWPRRSPLALFLQYLRHGAGRAGTIIRHRARLKLRQALPLMIAPAAAAGAIGALLAAFIEPAFLVLCLPTLTWMILSLVYGAVLGWRTQRPCAALSGIAAMIMHFAWSLGFWRFLMSGHRPGTEPEPLLLAAHS